MGQVETELKIGETKMEKMQNTINYMQITMRDKLNENGTPIINKRSASQASMNSANNMNRRQNRNIQILNEEMFNSTTGGVSKLSSLLNNRNLKTEIDELRRSN